MPLFWPPGLVTPDLPLSFVIGYPGLFRLRHRETPSPQFGSMWMKRLRPRSGPGLEWGFLLPPWRVLRGAHFAEMLFSDGGGVRELSLESGTLTAAMVDPEVIL